MHAQRWRGVRLWRAVLAFFWVASASVRIRPKPPGNVWLTSHLCLNTTNMGSSREFRRPPGVGTAKDARKWAAFALAFMSASLTTAWAAGANARSSTNKNATVAELQAFLKQGLTHLAGVTHNDDWNRIIAPTSFREDPRVPLPPSYYGVEMNLDKLEKASKPSSFEQKVRLQFSFLSTCPFSLLSPCSFLFLFRCSLSFLCRCSLSFLSRYSLSFLSTCSFFSYLTPSHVFGFRCTCSRC